MRRPIISICIGLILAAGALYVVYTARGSNRAEAASITIPTVMVLVAKTDIAFGDPIKADFIEFIDWPETAVPAEAALNKDDVLAGPEGERIAIRSFVKGEPLLKTKISGYGGRPILSRKVTDDMRAYSIRINDVNGVAGFLLPGDHVDIMLTRQLGSNRDNMITDVIIQNVSVLGIDQLASEETENPVLAKTATIEITPEQAQKLALAQQLGTLSLTLRNYADLESAEVKRISVKDLGLDGSKTVSRDNGIYVRVRKGTSNAKSQRVPK